MLDVPGGQGTARSTWGEALAVAADVTPADLPVDPAEAQGLVERVRVGEGRRLTALFVQHQPDRGVVGVVVLEPGVPCLGIEDEQLFELGHDTRTGVAGETRGKYRTISPAQQSFRAIRPYTKISASLVTASSRWTRTT